MWKEYELLPTKQQVRKLIRVKRLGEWKGTVGTVSCCPSNAMLSTPCNIALQHYYRERSGSKSKLQVHERRHVVLVIGAPPRGSHFVMSGILISREEKS